MPEALARIRREPTLSAPARETARPMGRNAKAAPHGQWRILPRTGGGYAGIFMVVALMGIVVNAVGLQHERHPAPLFLPDAGPASVGAAPAAILPVPSPAPSVPAPNSEAASPPAVKPAATAATPPTPPSPPPSPLRKTDPIGDLVRSGGASETAKAVLSVQRALIKLGYDLQADGHLGATTWDALHDFEKSHGLPATSDLSPRLIARLNGAAR